MTKQPHVVTRWRRYGHDRLYVTTAEGARLGYWDLANGTAHAEPGEDPAVVDRAAHEWLLALGPMVLSHEPVKAPADVASNPDDARPIRDIETTVASAAALGQGGADRSPEPDWIDLAATRAGAAARAEAKALRNAAPVHTFLARALRVKTDERAWRIGADGEEAVAAQLRKLGGGWHVLHAVPVGDKGSDIDHVVIGPAGFFTLNAKNHPDAKIWVRGNTFKVNGQNVPYIRNSRYEAARAERLITAATGINVKARGVIVVYGATGGLTIKEQPGDVHVIARRQIAGWLKKQPQPLAPEDVALLFDHARRSTTWRPAG